MIVIKQSRKIKAAQLEHYLNLAYEMTRDYQLVSKLMEDEELVLSQSDEEVKKIGAVIYILCKSIYSDYEVTFSGKGIRVNIKEFATHF